MNRIRSLGAAVLLAALLPGAAHAKPWHVTNLVAEPRVCSGPGLYKYNASWTPIIWENKPWASYNVEAHNCVTGPVQCTATRCTVSATNCRTGAPGAWIAVQANIGKSVSGVRANAVPPSRCQ